MSLRYCPTNKKHTVGDSDVYCEECGAKTTDTTPKCPKGHQIYNHKAKFCWSCGEALKPTGSVLDAAAGEQLHKDSNSSTFREVS